MFDAFYTCETAITSMYCLLHDYFIVLACSGTLGPHWLFNSKPIVLNLSTSASSQPSATYIVCVL